MRDDERGVATAVSLVLTLSLATLLVSGLLLASGGLLTDQRERTAERELTVVGEHLASELQEVDQLDDGSTSTATLKTNHPTTVAGSAYTVELTDSAASEPGTAKLVLDAAETSREVTVFVALEADADSPPVPGGDINIVLTDGKLTIEEGRR